MMVNFLMLTMVGFVVFLIMLIVALFKKKPKKMPLIGLAACFVLFAAGAPMLPPTPAEVEPPEAVQEHEATPSAEPAKPPAPEVEPASPEPDQEALRQAAVQPYEGEVGAQALGMGPLLGLISAVGLVVFLFAYIAAIFQKKPKKMPLIGLAACIFLLAVGLAVGPPTPAEVELPEVVQEQEATPSAEPAQPAAPEVEPASPGVNQEVWGQPEVQTYVVEIIAHSFVLSTALTELGELLNTPRFAIREWNYEVALQIVLVQQAIDELSAINPPPEMKEVHAQLLSGIRDIDQAMVILPRGLDSGNSVDIERATELMISGSAKLAEKTRMLEAALR